MVVVAQVTVAGRGVDVEVALLDVLAAVALVAGQAKGAFLEDRVALIPEGERQAQALLLVADVV